MFVCLFGNRDGIVAGTALQAAGAGALGPPGAPPARAQGLLRSGAEVL